MANEEQIQRLLQRIEQLSTEVAKHRQEVNELRRELLRLQGKEPVPDAANSFHTPPQQTYTRIRSVPGIENFIGLNLIHFVGIVILIIGLTIGVKYAIDANLISPVMRIALTYAAAILLFLLSLRLRKNYALFSMILFSGAMASAYFTTYAAYEYYALMSQTVAFALMLLFTFFTVFASLKYKRQEIAILGLVGAYGIPFFVHGKQDNALVLFSYIFIINVGVLLISFKKYWLALTYTSFFTTWLIYLSWLFIRFGHVDFNIGFIFCFAFFLLFLFNCLAFKLLKQQAITSFDTSIVAVNTLFLYISLLVLYQSQGRDAFETITLLFGITYLVAAMGVKAFSTLQQHFSNALFSIALTALILYAGMHFTGLTVTIIWVVLAVLLFIVGVLMKDKFFRIASIILFACTLIKLVGIDSTGFSAAEKVFAYIFTGTILLVISFLYQKFKHTIFGQEE